jgi:hypothetical protein
MERWIAAAVGFGMLLAPPAACGGAGDPSTGGSTTAGATSTSSPTTTTSASDPKTSSTASDTQTSAPTSTSVPDLTSTGMTSTGPITSDTSFDTGTSTAPDTSNTGTSTGDPPGCPVAPDDSACVMCNKANCCDQGTFCGGDPECQCITTCVNQGLAAEQCAAVCSMNSGVVEAYTCLKDHCSDQC